MRAWAAYKLQGWVPTYRESNAGEQQTNWKKKWGSVWGSEKKTPTPLDVFVFASINIYGSV
jgi:hypothetical protein